MGRGVGFGDLAGKRHQKRDGVLGGGDGVAVGRIHHHDAGVGGCLDVDGIDANAGAADHLEPARLGQRLGRNLGGRADDEAVIVADAGGKGVRIEALPHIDAEAPLFEDIGGERAHGIGDQNAGRIGGGGLGCVCHGGGLSHV